MDKTALVTNELELEGLVVEALSRAGIPVTAVDWTWVPQLEESQLVVVTSLNDTKGPREAYARLLAALSEAGIYQSFPIRRLFVKSPDDPVAKQLVEEIKTIGEGSIHVVKSHRLNNPQLYSVVFAPYSGSGGAIPSVPLAGDHELRQFLGKRIGIPDPTIEDVLTQLSRKNNASVLNVRISLRRAKSLNLVA